MIEKAWLKKLAPGTLLFNKVLNYGFFLVYHAEVKSLPGPWCQIEIWIVSPNDRLHTFDCEAGDFDKHWTFVDVA